MSAARKLGLAKKVPKGVSGIWRVRFARGVGGSARRRARPVCAAEGHAKDAAKFLADQVAAEPRTGTSVENGLSEGRIWFWADNDNVVKRNAPQAPSPAGCEVGGVDDDQVGIGGDDVVKPTHAAEWCYRPAAMIACEHVDDAFSHPPVGDGDNNLRMVRTDRTFVPRKGNH